MTAYRKNLLAWVVIMAVGLALGLAAMYVSQWFLVLFFLFIFVPQFFLREIKCGTCGTPVTYQGTLLGRRVQGGFLRRFCQQCGADLDREGPV